VHRQEIGRDHGLNPLRRAGTATTSLTRLHNLGITVEDQLDIINSALASIDQILIPSTINNFINLRYILMKEREIITVLEDAEYEALNYLISHVKLGLLFYKIKDHRNFAGQNRTEVIELLAVNRISDLSVLSKVIVLHALQMMKLPANAKGEFWVRNIILKTHQDDLSQLKTLTDAKGDYFCMNKLIYDDIRSESVRRDILAHFEKEARVQEAHMKMKTKKSKLRGMKAWRKVLSDVDDTLTCSGGSYPAGIDKRFGKKVVYPGVLAFYRELDLGTEGPEEWPINTPGNLVFLSARPHVYKDVSEKHNFAKFRKLRERGMHTIPSLLAGDVDSGVKSMLNNDMEPLAQKKFENFRKYVSIYPEFKHVFIGDNGQGDVRAGELMLDAFPRHVEAVYVHIALNDITKTHGYNADRWRKKGFNPVFFRNYTEAALDAATRKPPLIRMTGLQKICEESVRDFGFIQTKQWPSPRHKIDARLDLNQGIWRCNQTLVKEELAPVGLIQSEQLWACAEKVSTPYGVATILSFNPSFDMYTVEIDWRPLDVQVAEHKEYERTLKKDASSPKTASLSSNRKSAPNADGKTLETVVEATEDEIDECPADAEDTSCSIDSGKHHDTATVISDDGVSCLTTKSIITTATIRREEDSGGSVVKPPSPLNLQTNLLPQTGSNGSSVSLDAESLEDIGGRIPISNDKFPNGGSRCIATVNGRDIKKYSPPKLPTPPKENGNVKSTFSFWGVGGKKEESKQKTFNAGEQCNTPFGPATVNTDRADGIVVVDFIGWKGKGYLKRDSVRVVEKGIFEKLLGPWSKDSSSEITQKKDELKFPYALGTVIRTPFGEGVIVRPLAASSAEDSNAIEISSSDNIELKSEKKEPLLEPTIGIELTSWVLANEKHPIIYCTEESATNWKNLKPESSDQNNNVFSVVGKILTNTVWRMTTKTPKTTTPKAISKSEIVLIERYYKDGAAVTTQFGDGVVKSFRESDGFYNVSLVQWKKMGSVNPTAFLRKESLGHRLAKNCHEGDPVLTSLGLSGVLASVEPTTGIHLVMVPRLGIACYLQPENIIQPLVAAVGEDVFTPYGDGTVQKYRKEDDVYQIQLHGWGGSLFVSGGGDIYRVDNRIGDNDSAFGVKWLLRFFSMAPKDEKKGPGSSRGSQRSRSDSYVSLGT